MIDITLGFLLDLIIGDPQNPLHPIRGVGFICKKLESIFRSIFKNTLKLAGLLTWITVFSIVFLISKIAVDMAYSIGIILGILISSILIYFCISAKALKVEGLKVVKFIIKDDIEGARKQLSYIVGRDTKNLDREAILKAVIETVAENMCDGVIAPLLYIGIGGAPLGFAYKAVNTMDSMFGYKNDKYKDFGFFPAKIDDIFNYIPARLTGYFTIIVSFVLKLNWKNSYKIYSRDKYNHSSPNSAHSESAVAGALNIQLGGANYYFGKLVKKPSIGDNLDAITLEKVNLTNKILYGVAILGYIMAISINLLLNI